MKLLTFFVFAGLAVGQEKTTVPDNSRFVTFPTVNASASMIAATHTTAPLSKTDLLAIDNIAQRAAAVDRDKQELIAEICGKINTTAENCSIDTDKKTVSTKPAPKPEDARPPVKNTVK